MIKKISEGIKYQKLTESEMKSRGILGRLVGVCADFINPTRNGRKYSEQLWENVFNNPIMQEKIKNKVCYGELGHPADRAEIDPEKIAVVLSEQPVKNKQGQLEAVFDILDTPNGRILKTLCDYGSTLGISSRGQGDIITDYNGEESVDPDTYECECWDVVLVPAVETARLQYVREGLDTKRASLRKALTEAFNKENEEGKKVMAETLKDLDINIEEKSPENPVDEGVISAVGDAVNGVVDGAKELLASDEAEKKDQEESDENVADSDLFANIDVEETPEDLPEEGDSETEPEETEVELDIENPEEVEEEDTRTDEEIFLDYLVSNFDEKQIKKACKALDIEIPEEEEEIDGEEEAEEEDAEDKEDTKDDAADEEEKEGSAEEDKNSTDEESDEDKEDEEKIEEALDEGSKDLIKNLQEALRSKLDLEALVKTLKEKLAVSDAKVNELNEDCAKYRNSITRLSALAKSNKDLQKSVVNLEESLKQKDETINDQTLRISRLVKSRKDTVNESLSIKKDITTKQEELKSLNESVENLKRDYEKKFQDLREQVIKEDAENSSKIKNLNESLTKEKTLKESYKKLANEAMNLLIEERATQLGLTSTDIKRKLGSSYTIKDVNTVCEELKRYQLNVSKLPFSVDRKVSVRVNEAVSKNRNIPNHYNEDDEVDDGLIRLANLR